MSGALDYLDLTVVGCGYVGYPLSLLAAHAGHRVRAVDLDERVVTAVNGGEALVDEPMVVEYAASIRQSGRLEAALAPLASDVFIIAVPTPVDDDGRNPDLSAVEAAARAIAPHLQAGNLVVVESTVPPGTCTGVVAPVLEESGMKVGDDVLLAHCPERVHPGATIEELVHVERIIGGINEASTAAAVEFYSSFVKAQLIETDVVTAEICKLMENTYRDVNIALANQVGEITDKHGVDSAEAIRIANSHPRVNYLNPGIGVGGHCIPVDPWFLVSDVSDDGGVIGAARAVNDRQPERIARMIASEAKGIDTPRVVLVGAAYKPDVGDSRNAPALQVRRHLIDLGLDVATYDPLVEEYGGNLEALVAGADLIAVLVPHRRVVDNLRANPDRILARMRHRRILDYSTGAPRPL